MKKILLIMLLILAPVFVFSQGATAIIGYTPSGYEKITVTTGAVSRLDSSLRSDAGAVFITVESNDIRYRIDGGNPDANDGHVVDSDTNQNLWLMDNSSIRNLRMIAVGGNSTVIVTYYRRNYR